VDGQQSLSFYHHNKGKVRSAAGPRGTFASLNIANYSFAETQMEIEL